MNLLLLYHFYNHLHFKSIYLKSLITPDRKSDHKHLTFYTYQQTNYFTASENKKTETLFPISLPF